LLVELVELDKLFVELVELDKLFAELDELDELDKLFVELDELLPIEDSVGVLVQSLLIYKKKGRLHLGQKVDRK